MFPQKYIIFLIKTYYFFSLTKFIKEMYDKS